MQKQKRTPGKIEKASEDRFELVLTVVNRGFSSEVMEAATKSGATGGTMLNARGTYKEVKTILGMKIEPEKEVVLIVVNKQIAKEVIEEIYKRCGLSTPGAGICFALPISQITGLRFK
ncbi:MAG: P-II family nitrogen regulator [Firmicutes bacterium]|nr:P-II family nitrogen regulator [Bacillota bacterium]